MKFQNKIIAFTAIIIAHLAGPGEARAGVASSALQEVADLLLAKGGREVAKESAESITRKLGTIAEKYGEPGVEAARRGGPTAFRYLVEGGEQAPKVVKLFESTETAPCMSSHVRKAWPSSSNMAMTPPRP